MGSTGRAVWFVVVQVELHITYVVPLTRASPREKSNRVDAPQPPSGSLFVRPPSSATLRVNYLV